MKPGGVRLQDNPSPPKSFIEDMFRCHVFEEPLVPTIAYTTEAETTALDIALSSYLKRSERNDFSSITDFLKFHPKGSWNAALQTNLGLEYFNMGYYSKALDAWKQAWELAEDCTDNKGHAIANRAAGELAYMYGRLGRIEELDHLLKRLEHWALSGPATEKIAGAREGLYNMQARPEISFRCGPLALHRIKLTTHPNDPQNELVDATQSTQKGFSLDQVAELSRQLDLNFQIAFRPQGATVIVPSVMHFKLEHFAAIVRSKEGRYRIEDPTFKHDLWVTQDVIDAEASGYFLVPSGGLPDGWRTVDRAEAQTVFGKGNVPNPPDPPGPCDHSTDRCKPCPEKGMATAKIHLLNASLNITDIPVGYSPPVGPGVWFTVRYNQRDNQFASNFNYSNFGNKWTCDWLAFIKDDPSNLLADVNYYMMGGGNRSFSGFNTATQSFAFQVLDQTKLIRTSPTSYEMLSGDGSKKIFAQPDGPPAAMMRRFFLKGGGAVDPPDIPPGGTTRKVFLTQVVDPHGNAVQLTYDSDMRITTITDAIGQVTTLSYDHPADIFKITQVTDPFGRVATFDYDDATRLHKITDVIGLTSEFTYDVDGTGGTKSDFIVTISTPYGLTTFTKVEDGTTRALEILYPDGDRERVEFNQSTNVGISASDPPATLPKGMKTRNEFLAFRNTYHWDRQGCIQAYGDYTKARIYHWLHSADMQSPVGILESYKDPLESRVWYEYAGQSSPNGSIVIGSSNKPIHKGRVLDDGTTQLYSYQYNDFGHITKQVDPLGRTFSYVYAANGIDLIEVRQTRDGQSELLSRTTYNFQHLPVTRTDAAAQTSSYTYNGRGQVTIALAPVDMKTHQYDAKGYRTSIFGPLGYVSTWTYDSVGRVHSQTDVSGYTLIYDYDDLDRLTKVTYPDGTSDQFTFTKLDRTLIRDRAGRETSFTYDSVRQLSTQTDSLGRIMRYAWCKCGALGKLTDPMGRTTTWRYDVQGRLKTKEYVDGSQVNYRYDNAGRMRQRIDEKLQVTQYNYYLDNAISQITYTNASNATAPVTFSYDVSYSRVTSMTDGIGTTIYKYISITSAPMLGAGQLASIDGPLKDDTITFAYDQAGRRISTAINEVDSSLTYDPLGRVISQSNALGIFTTNYDGPSNRIASQLYPNGQRSDYVYGDNLQDRRLKTITNAHGITTVSEFIYGHDVPADRISSWSQQADTELPAVYNYTYDSVNQLMGATLSVGGAVIKNFIYTYDFAGNRLTKQVDGITRHFSYNALNELTSADDDGLAQTTYQWDAEHRLISIATEDKTIEFSYDGLGRRVNVRELLNGEEISNRRFIWCDNYICEEHAPSGLVMKRFFPQGVKIENGAMAGSYFYTKDHLGSIRELVDSTGTIRARFEYDPYGMRSHVSGDVESDFGFTGHLYNSHTSTYLAQFRTYDPSVARWLSREPLPSAELLIGANLYVYVGNDPINHVDADGRAPDIPPGADPWCFGLGLVVFVLCLRTDPRKHICKKVAQAVYDECVKTKKPPCPNFGPEGPIPSGSGYSGGGGQSGGGGSTD